MEKNKKKYRHSMTEIKKHCTAGPEKSSVFKKLRTIHEAFEELLSTKLIMDSIKNKTCYSLESAQNVIGEVQVSLTFGNDKTSKHKQMSKGIENILGPLMEARKTIEEKLKTKKSPKSLIWER